MNQPNVVFVFSDQHRWQATGYAGDPNVHTPNMDRLRAGGIDFPLALSNCPVCAPNRASLLTGQYPLTHRVVYNDVQLSDKCTTFAHAFAAAGYDTAYIGKWHVHGTGRDAPISGKARLGFDFWRVLECSHAYNHSYYYDNDDALHMWEGYDAFAQTDCALEYMRMAHDDPYLLVLSWGPPHDPYRTAPEEYRQRFAGREMVLRPNVPAYGAPYAQANLPGYYAHIEALDDALGRLMDAADDNTIFIYTSDHGDMLGSQGWGKKQKPWEENIRIPFLMRLPTGQTGTYEGILNTPDVAPTLLGLCGVPVPETMEGLDLSDAVLGRTPDPARDGYLANVTAFGEWARCYGGREWRAIRTPRYTYAITLEGPWLLYDNEADPYQMRNLIDDPAHAALRADLHARLQALMASRADDFLPGEAYARRWGYPLDESGTVPFAFTRKVPIF